MIVRTVGVILRVEPSEPGGGRAAAERLLAWMEPHFQPVAVSGLWGDRTLPLTLPPSDAAWNGVPLWPGEQVTDGPLSRMAGADFAIRDRLARELPDGEFGCVFHGALWHQPPLPGHETGWYARVKVSGQSGQRPLLLELAQVWLAWTRTDHRVSLRLPLAGYPLTLAVPGAGEASINRTERLEAVEANRRRVFDWMRALPARLGVPGLPDWEVTYDDAPFDEDVEALREWEQRLQEGDR